LSDAEKLMDKIASEFSGIVSASSIGKTWQGRSMRMLTLDARSKVGAKSLTQQAQDSEVEETHNNDWLDNMLV